MSDPVSFKQIRFVNDEPVVLKKGGHSVQTVVHEWCACDYCHSEALVDKNDLKSTWTCPTCLRSSSRKAATKTPVCKGRTVNKEKITHEPVEMASADPVPGRPCWMTPGCNGKLRPPAEEGVRRPRNIGPLLPSTCQRCRQRPAAWLVLDAKAHTYLELNDGQEELRSHRQREAYVLCETCKKDTSRFNKATKKSQPRKLEFLRWQEEGE